MKCLVINLDRSSERLAYMRGVFSQLDIAFDRFPAVDGSQLSQAWVDEVSARHQWIRPLTQAELGCFLSHRGCWEQIASGNESFGAIFEDDIRISPNAQALLGSSEWIPPDADFIKLETRNRAITIGRTRQSVAKGYDVARLFSFHDGLGGYIVSKQCAQHLCALAQQPLAPVDQWLLNPDCGIFTDLKVFQLTPAICIPDEIARASTIDLDGRLYESDEALLQAPAKRNRMQRKLRRLRESLQRLLSGRRRTRIAYR